MKRKFTISLTALFFGTVSAQQSIGLQTGNFSTPYSSFINPANAYANKARLYLNFYTPTMGYTTNAFNYNFPVNPFRLNNNDYGSKTNPNGSLQFSDDFLTLNVNQNNKGFLMNENFGPSFFLRAHTKYGFGFGVKSVSAVSFSGIDNSLAQVLRYGPLATSKTFINNLTLGQTYNSGAFGVDAMDYQEYFFTLGAATHDKGRHVVSVGGTLKGLVGNGYMGIHSNGLNYKVNANNSIDFSNYNLSFAHTNDPSATNIMQQPWGLNFNTANGGGAGLDLGVMYENRKNSNRRSAFDPATTTCLQDLDNSYRWKIGASLTDLGFIAFNGSKSTAQNVSGTTNYMINPSLINNSNFNDNYDRLDKIDTGFMNKLNSVSKDNFAVSTPAAFNVQFDANLGKGYFLGANLTQNLLKSAAMGVKRNSYLALTPRYETESFEIGVPLVLNQDYSRFNMGLYSRFGPLVIGTDNIAGLGKLIANSEHSGANFYFATRFKINLCKNSEYYQEMGGYDTTKVVTTDTNFWQSDSIVKKRIDTVYIMKYDTLVIEKPVNNNDILEVLKRREANVKLREDNVLKREQDVAKRESSVGTSTGNSSACCNELAVLKTKYENISKENLSLNKENSRLKTEIEYYKKRILELEGELNKCKSTPSTNCKSVEDELKRVKGQLILCKMGGEKNNTNAQIKSLDSLYQLEKSKNVKLQLELDKTKDQLDAAKKQIKEYIQKWGENGDCCKKYQTASEEISALKKQLADYELCKQKVQSLEAEIVKLKTKLAGGEVSVGDCAAEKAKIAELQAELNKTKTALEAQGATISSLNKKLEDCQKTANDVAKLQAELDSKNKKITELEKELESNKKTISDKTSIISALQAQLDECKKLGKADCSKCEEELAQVKVELTTKQNAYTALLAEYNVLLANYNNCTKQLVDCSKNSSGSGASADEIKKLNDKISALNRTIAELNGQIKSRNETIETLDKDNEIKQKQIEALKLQLAELQKQLNLVLAQKTSLQIQLDECNKNANKSKPEGKLPDIIKTKINEKVGGNPPSNPPPIRH